MTVVVACIDCGGQAHAHERYKDTRCWTCWLKAQRNSPMVCVCEKPIVETFWGGRQCRTCGRPFLADLTPNGHRFPQ